jgi:hypothetical protein
MASTAAVVVNADGVLAGVVALWLGAGLFVRLTVRFARRLGASELMIGPTMVTVGGRRRLLSRRQGVLRLTTGEPDRSDDQASAAWTRTRRVT